jgi:hypothetical protein
MADVVEVVPVQHAEPKLATNYSRHIVIPPNPTDRNCPTQTTPNKNAPCGAFLFDGGLGRN